MINSRATQSMRVTTDGKNLVSHAGTALLSELADRSGLTEAMSVAMSACGINWHTHDPGVVLTHLAVAIADGADCLADMLRPGRAGANHADDHVTLLHHALSGLPEEYQTGHFTDDHPALVTHPIPSWCGRTRPGPLTGSWTPSCREQLRLLRRIPH